MIGIGLTRRISNSVEVLKFEVLGFLSSDFLLIVKRVCLGVWVFMFLSSGCLPVVGVEVRIVGVSVFRVSANGKMSV